MIEQETTSGFRMSPQQEALWAAEPQGPTASVQAAIGLEGQVNTERLLGALQQLVGRHEILRTSFRRAPGMSLPFQVVSDEGSVDWEVTQLLGDEPKHTTALNELLRAERAKTWTYDGGPVLRALLVTLAPERSVLALNLPAVCADASSVAVLVGELATLYDGGQIAADPLQYADFAEWQAQLLESDQTRDLPAPTDDPQIPFTSEEPSRATFDPVVLPIQLDDIVTQRLESVNGDAAASDVVFASFGVALCKLAGVDRASVGCVVDGRHLAELRGAIGPLSKVASVSVPGDMRAFGDVVGAVAAARNETTGRFESLPRQALGAVPGAAFEWRSNMPRRGQAGVVFSAAVPRSTVGGYHLKLIGTVADDTPKLELLYDSARVPAETAERLMRSFEQVLSAVVAQPDVDVETVNVVPEAERVRMLVDWNETERPVPYDCVHRRFETQVERTPERIALRDGLNELTFAELNERANQLAHRLRSLGVGPDVVVGMCMDRSTDMVTALLAILKAGGAYLPLHTEHPLSRLTGLLTETAAPVLVTQEAFADRFGAFGGEVVCVDQDRESLLDEATSNPERVNGARDLVYVMYTSGSTGRPKGVAVTHGGLSNYAAFMVETLRAEQEVDGLTFALVSAVSTDLGNTCVFPPLVSGGTLHLIDPATSMDGAELSRVAAARPYDVLKITPSHLGALLATGEAGLLPRRCLILGGEASTPELIERVRADSDCMILNHYGPTETTVGSCTFDAARDISEWRPVTVPIGRPIANTTCYILDEWREPVPIGVAGELYVGGAGVARGYLEQPGETAKRFLESPFRDDERLYATGDLARYLPDGTIEFLGRSDRQVKIRGFRIELAEVETALAGHPAVREVAVMAREDVSGQRLVAYVVGAPDPGADALRARAAEVLPDYMVPSAFVSLDTLPRTESGKVDRLSLPAPEAPAAAEGYVPPSTPAEEEIARIWAEVLGVERVGVRDDFFELGGHSLLATQVIARARNALGVQVPLNVFFIDPTIHGLAKATDDLRSDGDGDELTRLLDDLESLSDAEAEELLEAELGSRRDAE